jgi:DNA-binding MarR family transcriptional regulator
VTNLIDGLEKSGLARRVPHDRDRRTTLAQITERGREVAAGATDLLNEQRFGTAPLTRGQLEDLAQTLARLRADADDFPQP